MQVSDIYPSSHDYKEKLKKVEYYLKMILLIHDRLTSENPNVVPGRHGTFDEGNAWMEGREYYMAAYDLTGIKDRCITDNLIIVKNQLNIENIRIADDILISPPLISPNVQQALRRIPLEAQLNDNDVKIERLKKNDRDTILEKSVKIRAAGALKEVTSAHSIQTPTMANKGALVLRDAITDLQDLAETLHKLTCQASEAFSTLSERTPHELDSPAARLNEMRAMHNVVYSGYNTCDTTDKNETDKMINEYISAQDVLRPQKKLFFTEMFCHDFVIMELIMLNERTHSDYWTPRECEDGREFLRERIARLEGKDSVSIALRDLYSRLLSLKTVLGYQIASRDGLALKAFGDARVCAPSECEYRYLQFVLRRTF